MKTKKSEKEQKTIYIEPEDIEMFDKATKLAGGTLSCAVAHAVRRYVECELETWDDKIIRSHKRKLRQIELSAAADAKHGIKDMAHGLSLECDRVSKWGAPTEDLDNMLHMFYMYAAYWVKWVQS